MRIDIRHIDYDKAVRLLNQIDPSIASQMEETKVVDEMLVKLGFARNAPISVDLDISVEQINHVINIAQFEYDNFIKSKSHKWEESELDAYYDYCDLVSFFKYVHNFFVSDLRFTELYHTYQELKKHVNIGEKIKINHQRDCIEIEFNDYLHISGDASLLYLNGGLNHYHFEKIEDMINWIVGIANGDIIFIENKCWFSLKRLTGILLQPWNLKQISKEKFSKKRETYMKNKYLRIYTGNKIIKFNEKGRKI